MPVNYYYSEEDNKIYFHGAREGHKVDALKRDDKVCSTVYGNETIKEEISIEHLSGKEIQEK